MSELLNCSFCSTKREVGMGTKDLMIFEDTRLLKLLCGQISLPLTIGDLKSPFKGFVSCPVCHHLYQSLTDLYAQFIRIKDRVRVTIEDLRCRMELSQSQQTTNLNYEVPCDSSRSNDEKLRSAIMEKYSLEWPRVCGSPWTVNLHEPSESHNSEGVSETSEVSHDPAHQYTKKPSKPKTHGRVDVPVLVNFESFDTVSPAIEGGVNFKVTNRRKASKVHTMYSIRSAIVPSPEETKSQMRNEDNLNDASSGSGILPDPLSESGQCQPPSVLPELEKRRTLSTFKNLSVLSAFPSQPVAILPASEERGSETNNVEITAESPKSPKKHITASVKRRCKKKNAEKIETLDNHVWKILDIPNLPSRPTKPPKFIVSPLINTTGLPPPINTSRLKPTPSVSGDFGLRYDSAYGGSNSISKHPIATTVSIPNRFTNNLKRKNLSKSVQLAPKWARVLKFKTSDVQVSSQNAFEDSDRHFSSTQSQTKNHEATTCSNKKTSELLDSSSNLDHTLSIIQSHSKHCNGNLIANCTAHGSHKIKGLKMSPSPNLSTKKSRQRKSPVTSTSHLNYEIQDLDGGNVIRRNVNPNESIQIMLESEIPKHFECEFCGPLIKLWDEEGLIEHLISCHNGEEKRHACPIRRCKKTFVSNLLLEKHLRTVGTNSITGGHSTAPIPSPVQDYTCEFCPKIIRSVSNFCLVRHLFRHEREYTDKPLKCVKCGKGYASTFLLKRHVKRHTQDRHKPLACETCDARFSKDDQQGLEKHKKTSFFHRLDAVDKGLQNCRVCDKCITPQYLLRSHEYRHHPELRTHQCNICDETYVLKSFLETHLRTHGSTGPYTCLHCWNTCSSSETLGKHLISHTGLRNKYKLQAYQNTLTGYSNHTALRMNQNRKFQCSICSRGFSLQRYLNSHKKHCQAVWTCEICDKIFGHSSLLHFHKQFVHERPNKCLCEHCGKAFPAPSRLKIHLRTHADKSKWEFVCYFCNNRFISWSNLKGHMALHTNEKGYVCQVCKTTFMQQWQLRSHTKRRVCASK